MQSFVHLPLGLSDHNKVVLWPRCESRAGFSLHTKNVWSLRFVVKRRECCCHHSTGVALICTVHHEQNVNKEQHHKYVLWTSNNRVMSSGELYCCLLPQCKALRTCRSGFPIATPSKHLLVFVVWASCSCPLLVPTRSSGAVVEQPFDCLIVQNCQAVQPMGRSMDWTVKGNRVDGLFFCATLASRRGGHTPFVQAGVETPDTSAEAVKPDLGCSWEGHSEGVSASVGKVRSLQVLSNTPSSMVIRPMRRACVVVRWTDELLCGKYKWMSWFETSCIRTWWTGERWVEQVSRLHGTAG